MEKLYAVYEVRSTHEGFHGSIRLEYEESFPTEEKALEHIEKQKKPDSTRWFTIQVEYKL